MDDIKWEEHLKVENYEYVKEEPIKKVEIPIYDDGVIRMPLWLKLEQDKQLKKRKL